MENARKAAAELRRAVVDCRERALAGPAKWAAQQLVGLPPEARESDSGSAVATGSSSGGTLSRLEADAYQLARSLFDLRVSQGEVDHPSSIP